MTLTDIWREKLTSIPQFDRGGNLWLLGSIPTLSLCDPMTAYPKFTWSSKFGVHHWNLHRFGGQPNPPWFYFSPCGFILGGFSSTKVASGSGGELGIWLNTRWSERGIPTELRDESLPLYFKSSIYAKAQESWHLTHKNNLLLNPMTKPYQKHLKVTRHIHSPNFINL